MALQILAEATASVCLRVATTLLMHLLLLTFAARVQFPIPEACEELVTIPDRRDFLWVLRSPVLPTNNSRPNKKFKNHAVTTK
ncbi:hypothetical protein DPMN_146320 [Dreissena polymorpha]|uniref:Uncharacterized protein n=1 Tax=Dreissena polymorpha TaxID=45954 RepID=A0A9D4FA35_DREPO|nr:hypothetical protein DPMN_146320 [Dreissena polymorpha]